MKGTSMPVVTVPKSVTKGEELVVILKKDYETYLKWQKKHLWDDEKLTPKEQRQVAEGRRDIARGDYYSWKEVKDELRLNRHTSRAQRS